MRTCSKMYVTIIYLFLAIFQSFATDLYDEAVAAFRANKPLDAQKLILEVIQKEGPDATLYNYLGIAYYQTKNFDKSVDSFVKGAMLPFANKALLYFNAANSSFVKEDYRAAEKYYTQSLSDDGEYAASYLNRANTRIKLQDEAGALSDYTAYLERVPESIQKESIDAMIAYLQNLVAESESK